MKTNYDKFICVDAVLLGCASIASIIIKHYLEIDTIYDYVAILIFSVPCIFDQLLYFIAYNQIQFLNLTLLVMLVGLAIAAMFVSQIEGDPLVLLL